MRDPRRIEKYTTEKAFNEKSNDLECNYYYITGIGVHAIKHRIRPVFLCTDNEDCHHCTIYVVEVCLFNLPNAIVILQALKK